MPDGAFASDAPCRPLLPVDAATEKARSCPSCALPRALLLVACAGPVRECLALVLAACLCREMRGRSQLLEEVGNPNWDPNAAGNGLVRLILGVFLKRGLDPQANPGPLWSLQVCHAMPHGHSHLAAVEDRMQHGHFNCVQAVPFTKVDLAASLSFLQVGRGHCNMNEAGVGDICPTPSAQVVSSCSLRSSFSAKAAASIDCPGISQGNFWGSRKQFGIKLPFLDFLPGRLRVRS